MAEETDAIDLDAYFRRIGYDGPRPPTLRVLRDLIRLHTLAIPFENLDPLRGRIPALDLASLQDKLVASRRGGYCFEHNALLQAALRAIGFEARALGARVLLNKPDGAIPARTHMLLRVEVEGESHLADVGFGGLTPTGPLRFVPGPEQATPHEPYRIEEAGPEYELSARVGERWSRLYRFHLIEHVPIDHEVNNHFVASRPDSFLRNAIVAVRAAPAGRHLLMNDRLTFQHPDGRRDERLLPDAGAVIAALAEVFGIDVPDETALAEAFSRIAGRARGAEAGGPARA